MEGIFFITLFIIFIVAAIAFGIWQQANTITEWQALAEELKLRYIPASSWGVGRIEGSYNGLSVLVGHYTEKSDTKRIYTEGNYTEGNYTQRSREIRDTWTKIVTRFHKPLPSGLKIYQETAVLSNIDNFFGGQDIQVQDIEFDDAFIIKGEPEDAVRRLLTPPVRAALMRYKNVTDLCMDEYSIIHRERGLVSDASHIRHILDAQHEVAKALCDVNEASESKEL